MDLYSIGKKMQFSRDSYLSPVLVIFIIWGLITKFFISVNLRLDSDAVGMGILSMEIGKYHNFLLSGCHISSADPLVFTELVPFHLIPQILTNYSPLALKVMVFFIFVLSIMVLAYLVWSVSGNFPSALLFAALAANIPSEGYFWFAYPNSHNATTLFGAVILVILFYYSRLAENQQDRIENARKKKTGETNNIRLLCSAVLIALVFLSVISDTLIVVIVLVPFVLTYLLFYGKKTGIMNSLIISLVITSVVAYLLKTYMIPGWIKTNYEMNGISEIFFVKIPLFFKTQLLLLNNGLSAFAGGSAAMGPLEIISLVLFAGVMICCIKNWRDKWHSTAPEQRLLSGVLLLSVLVMAISFIFSGYSYNITATRYVTFTALALFMLVAMTCPVSRKGCGFLVISLLLVSAIAGSLAPGPANTNPNGRELGLITYLKSQNLSYGYGTYWDSNIITYLSGENVTVRSMYFLPDDLMQNKLNSCDRWYTTRPDRMFLIYDTNTPEDRAQKNFPLLVKPNNTMRVLQYQDYEIYPFNNS
jgi:hypothetical protein